MVSRADPEGGGAEGLGYYKAMGYRSNTDADPLENHKATKSAFNDGPLSARQRNVI